MKKLFIVLALTGLVGTASAKAVASFTGTKIEMVKGGDDKKKKKKSKKADCSTTGAAANGKACSKDGQAGGCCKDKQAAQPAPAPAPAPAAKPQ